ncbi:G-type lectin S-receptor-like serine/threonine-protein kinase At1g11300 [Silene latifolia]|uniref:G-type lectin S-receptor-like serine/threonine-protein kinase At1g11300 n=1 Tax=Silene latifolia TaxID=37657 RepID=UPI003D7728CC
MLKFSNDGDVQVIDEQKRIYWSSNVSHKANSSVAQLLNTGNLILLPKGSDSIIWQSFDYPTDSLLPGVKLIFNKSMYDTRTKFLSWKSNTDPSSGQFRLVSLPRDLPEFFIVDGDKLYWRSGPWNGYLFVGVPYSNSEAASGLNLDNHDTTVELSYESTNLSLFVWYVLTYDGILALRFWNASSSNNWENGWQSLQSECDVYGKCGKFALCNPKKEPICECLKGFNPENIAEWRKGNWTTGCVRRTELQCRAPRSKEDKFLLMKDIKVPDYAHWILARPDDCQRKCKENCSCLAYSYYSGIGCMLWDANLIDLQQYPADGANFYVRLAHSELPGESGKRKIIIAITVISSAFVSIASVVYLWAWITLRNGKKKRAKETLKVAQWQSIIGAADSGNDFQDLPLFKFTKLVNATDNFAEINKLGRGGFGTVYKGTLEDGEEVAVKRLSKLSGQGLTEFVTEVLVISKLQHRNLVRLLGCCVEGEEKLLVYEYMPNKSLDALLFDRLHQELQGWKTRFNIIQGICRGLLYLHRDSRLRIIHRDLKASNILLDDELNPKISDFGMAKIFKGKEDQADTNRVVGTYGYMSPEYAMEGRFSEKSDVFSFGVVLLEIVSGRRNSSFKEQESLSLLGHAWKLWNEGDIQSLIDPAVLEPGFLDEIFRCIQVALLCVQELPEDRPNISMIISMIESELLDLPCPTQPGFTLRRYATQNQALQDGNVNASVNHISLSHIIGR